MKSLKLLSLAIAMLISNISFSQEKTITGIVSDAQELPLPGATIIIKGTQKGVQTGFDGGYKIQAKIGDILLYQFLGMVSQSRVVGDQNIINVKLKDEAKSLCEVVVVSGYGISKSRKQIPIAKQKNSQKTVINNDKTKITNFVDDIIDKSKKEFNINNEPIFFINGYSISRGKLSLLNLKDFEDIAIVKVDEAKKAFGYKGRNGVILITTKNKTTDESNKIEKIENELINKNIDFGSIDFDELQESYESFAENQFENPKTAPLSTFSIDVDNASYTNVRRFINNGQTVPKDAVRVEEMVNFFKYKYPEPLSNDPFSINTEYSDCPWNEKHRLIKIGLQGKSLKNENIPNSNFVFLIDVSGSMSDENKLPLLKESLKILVKSLRKEDKVSIVVYAGAAGMVLPPTSGNQKQTIVSSLDNLNAGGSTAGGAGIMLAYKIAEENFIKGGNNRVILATDGDFNVGASSDNDMQSLIEEKRKSGVFLTCLGYGMGNYKDTTMEILADKGNGNYAYIDNIQEANRFLGKEFKGSMFAIAKDVKIQIEFNPKHVQSYRLIGYENRKLRSEDFKNDAIDAGELGSGHTVTALYEIIPTGIESIFISEPAYLKYTKTEKISNSYTNELATIKFRYKKPDGDKSIEMVNVIENNPLDIKKVSEDFKFSAAVAWFGLKLRNSKLVTNKSTEDIKKLAKEGLSEDEEGYKAEFIRLIDGLKQI